MSDPRRGLPSASIMDRLAKCSGSLALINRLRVEQKLFEPYDPARELGLKIHAWLAAKRRQEITETLIRPADLALASKAEEMARDLIAGFLGEPDQIIVEHRFWYHQGIKPLFSGQPDLVAIKDDRALILNYKTGRLEAEESADNLQLRTEVVLLKKYRPTLSNIRAAIVEPFVSWESQVAEYSEKTFVQAEGEILEIVLNSHWRKDERQAGPWCKYCPARSHCREAIQYVESLPMIKTENAVAELPRGEPGTQFWERIKVAKKLIEAWETAYTAILEQEPEALPGYILPAQGRERRFVPQPARFKDAFAEYLTAEEIDGCATYHLTKLEELLGLKMKISGKELERLFANVSKHVVGTTHDAPFIRKLTKKERQAIANEHSVRVLQ